MPTYEYVCGVCGHEFEIFHSILADPVRKCPACGKLKVERKISIGAAVLFKGGGFYQTDYRSDSYTKAAEADRKATEPAKETKATSDGATAPGAKDGKDASSTKGAGEKPAASSAPPKEAPAKESPKDPPSKATHPSRVGRGAGNVVQNPPKPAKKKKR